MTNQSRVHCGFVGDAESVASLTGIENNLLPYWLTQFPDHPLGAIEVPDEAGDRFVPTVRPATRWH
jgi:hypothetical protein